MFTVRLMATELCVASPRAFTGPLLVTLAYVVLYYLLISNQLRVRMGLRRAYRARGEAFDRYFHTDREMLAADRYVGNMLEHMPTFLLLLWLNAVFVGPRDASITCVYGSNQSMRSSRTSSYQKRSGSSREKRRKPSRSWKPSRCMNRQTLVFRTNSGDGSQIMRTSIEQVRNELAGVGGDR